MRLQRRIDTRGTPAVALETTLLVHGVPRASALPLFESLSEVVREAGAVPALIGVIGGRPTVGVTAEELSMLLDEAHDGAGVAKANTANLGALCHHGSHAATTVSATMELAAKAGVRVFATGGLGGVHKEYGARLDISADLTALARLPVAVVASGVKSLLDVAATREALETLGVPVVGVGTRRFPAFYLRELAGVNDCDARFDGAGELAAFVRSELVRREAGVVLANPVPASAALEPEAFDAWLGEAERRAEAAGARGRDATPAVLAALHEISGGATLEANLALVRDNARVAAEVAAAMGR
jgi:pseudouridine-5'-phosphate glycosidase